MSRRMVLALEMARATRQMWEKMRFRIRVLSFIVFRHEEEDEEEDGLDMLEKK